MTRSRERWDPAVWNAARRLYESGESFLDIAMRLGVPRNTIVSWCRRDGWRRDVASMAPRTASRVRRSETQTRKASASPAGRRAAKPKLSLVDRTEFREQVWRRLREIMWVWTEGSDHDWEIASGDLERLCAAAINNGEATMISVEIRHWLDRDERGEPQPPVDRGGYESWLADRIQRMIDESAALEPEILADAERVLAEGYAMLEKEREELDQQIRAVLGQEPEVPDGSVQ